jgi:hypothetical protein
MALLGTCFKFPPIQGVTEYFYRDFKCFAPAGQTFAYGRVPSSLGISAATDGSVTGCYSKATGTDWAGNPVTFQLSFPESVPSGEDTVYTAGGETEGFFYYNPGSSPNPDGNNCGHSFSYSIEFRLWDFIDDITGSFPSATFAGDGGSGIMAAGLSREWHFKDNTTYEEGLGTGDNGGSGNCGSVQLSTIPNYSTLDGSLFLYGTPYNDESSGFGGSVAPFWSGCPGHDASFGFTTIGPPARLGVPTVPVCLGLPTVVPGIAASFAAFTSIRAAATGGGFGLYFAIGRALAINDKYVLVTWVMMADGNTFIRPSCTAYPTPGGADVVIPCPDLKTLDAVAGDLYPLNASTTALNAQPIGLLTKILVGYDCTTWAAAGNPF